MTARDQRAVVAHFGLNGGGGNYVVRMKENPQGGTWETCGRLGPFGWY